MGGKRLGPCTHQSQDLLSGEELAARGQLHPLLGHAVQAAQIAALCQGYPKIGVLAPAHMSVDWTSGILQVWYLEVDDPICSPLQLLQVLASELLLKAATMSLGMHGPKSRKSSISMTELYCFMTDIGMAMP